jgi:hypothetical protein
VACADAAITAFHHEAAPVLLPYVELVDKKSWWSSQALLWPAIIGCVSRHSVYMGLFDYSVPVNEHTNYPKGRYQDTYEFWSLRSIYGKLAPWPINIDLPNFKRLTQGDCENTGLPAQSVFQVGWKSGKWMKEPAYFKCLSLLKPRFDSFIESGNLSKTDFFDFDTDAYLTKECLKHPLVKCSTHEVFWIRDDKIRHLFPNSLVFASWGYEWTEVAYCDCEILGNIPIGAPVDFKYIEVQRLYL